MATAKITSKGQITIPKRVRTALGVDAGDRLEFVIRDDGVVEIVPRTRSVLSLAGIVKPRHPVTTVEQMNDSIAEWVVDRFDESVR